MNRPWLIGWDDFWKFSQIFMCIGQTSSVILIWTLVLMKDFKHYQKVQHKFLLWCEILICKSCHFMRYSKFKISRFYISVRVSHYVLCLQRLLFVDNVLFLCTRLSIFITLGVKHGIWSQILHYYTIFHIRLCLYEIEIFYLFPVHSACVMLIKTLVTLQKAWIEHMIWKTCYAECENLIILQNVW